MSFFPKQPSSRAGVTQTIAFDASAAIANAFGAETFQLRLVANAACSFRIGDGAQTATTSDTFLPANVIDYVIVSPGQRISAVKAASNGLVTATAGTLWITEMS
jgi:endonuclease/exonuclease/phosphatase family metal-dependent hydrolase